MESKLTNVTIIVEGGMVSSVFSDGNVTVEVIDLDTQDADQLKLAESAYDEAKKELADNKTHIVW